MKKLFSFALAIIFSLFLTGCVGNSAQTPSQPISGVYKFDAINLNFIQNHQPENVVYQDKSVVETKLNNEIKNQLAQKNLLSANSSEQIHINLDYQREFVGEATFAKTDSIGNIFFTYEIKIIKNNEIVRAVTQNNKMRYNPGFFGNLKTIAGANRSDDFENGAIVAIAKELVEQIEKIK
ncbi:MULTISPECIES: hypothetical protein [unclassified Campylobacter]|uniref:hypothetical protein n=1 Tax=unclassified Campylobacter TaxID=2593542 RepID=UPI0022E9CBD9|nr:MULTISPECIES: hypothetical protein [unclassified Campylobacter]MDA3062701.1 hypothetical protein [Campylobacter sp. JMF_14 EL1]MDA3073998.1 hypothetical protein [Campylobacter sp. JMF_10 EL2]